MQAKLTARPESSRTDQNAALAQKARRPDPAEIVVPGVETDAPILGEGECLMAQNENSTRLPSTIIEKANSAAQSAWGRLWPGGHTGGNSPIMVN